MTLFAKIFKGMLGCALAFSLLPLCAYADDVENDADSDRILLEDTEDDIFLSEEDETEGETRAVSRSGIQDDATIIDEGDFGEGNMLHWAYWDDATLVVSGSGYMPDYTDKGNQPWNVHIRTIEKVVVEDGVLSVGAYSFHDSDLLTVVELADSLQRMGDHAFCDCDLLEEISLPNSISEIGPSLFESCDALKTCCLSDSLEVLSARAFAECRKLEHIDIPLALKRIGEEALYFCAGLKSLELPTGLIAIEEGAFWSCTVWGNVMFPGTLETVASSLTFTNFVVHGTVGFQDDIRQSCVNTIMSQMKSCEYVSYPKSLEIAPKGREVKYGYIVAAGNSNNVAVDGVLYSRASKGVLKYDDKWAVLVGMPESKSGTFSVPEGTKELGKDCLSNSISSVQIPSSVEMIVDDCSEANLADINVHEANSKYCSQDGILFNKDMTELIRCPRAHVFDGPYAIPDTVESFGGVGLQACVGLTDVIASRGMTEIKVGFVHCSNLVAIYLPREVKVLAKDGFTRSDELFPPRNGLNVFYEGSKDDWSGVSIYSASGTDRSALSSAAYFHNVVEHGVCDDGLLYYIDHDGILNIVPDEKALTLSVGMMNYGETGVPWGQYADMISALNISNKITSIGNNAFKGLSNIRTVSIPYSIESIGGDAFAQCDALVDVECEGGCFEVQPADATNPSFDASRVTLHVSKDESEWKNEPAYDSGSRTWNGYRLEDDLANELPRLSGVSLIQDGTQIDSVKVFGLVGGTNRDVALSALSASGKDMTDRVDIAIEAPERKKKLSTVPFGNWEYQEDELKVAYNEKTHSIRVGSCAIAGDYKITITPREHAAGGDPIMKILTVTRAPEQFYSGSGSTSSANTLRGEYASSDSATISVSVWNQYCEDVLDNCSILAVTDVLTGSDITDVMEEYGIKGFTGQGIKVSQFANPRDYCVSFYDPSGEIGLNTSVTIKLHRAPELLNQPYSLVLFGGSSDIGLQDDEQWASVPYRVRVLDGYDDPCWPELDWSIKDSAGNDFTDCFAVDAQGYLKIDAATLKNRLTANSESFGITALADGCDYKGSTSPRVIRESNELDLSLLIEPEEPPAVMHTATFMIGNQVVENVAFAEGDTSLDEPAVPQKDNYVGAWEEYDLASATGDIVIQGRYTPLDPDKISDIELKGDANYENGAVTISLAASAASKQIRIQSTQTRPLDVVLVCDQSGSMDETLGSGEKKVDALKRCANQFVNALYENSVKTKADHRVALVGFSYSEYSGDKKTWNASGYENTGLLVTQSGGFKKFGDEARRSYDEAFLSVAGSGGVNNRIVAGINSITAEGATAADLGLNLAKGVFAANPDTGTNGVARERVVVFITDGVPTDWSNERERMKTTGANAIQIARDIKQGQGAHIYSVGVDAQASPSVAFWSSSDGVGYSGNALSYDLNRFLHAVSSNYPGAAAMDALGSGTKDGGYYMAVNDTVNLNKIFSSILYSTVYTVESFDRATLVYTLPANFILTMKQEEEMRAALMEQGLAEDDIIVSETGGTTTIVFKNVKVKTEYENGVPRYVAQVKFQVSAKNGVSGSVSAGSASVDKNGDVTECVLSDVVVPQDRCVLVFKVNDAVYEVRDAAMGDVVELPDTDIARWMDLEKKVDPKVDSAYAIFETTTLDRKYTLRWVVGDNELVEAYAPGATVRVPKQVEQWVPEDHDLEGWAPSLPSTMPGRNIMCTAVLTPKHEHAYTAFEYRTGDCTKGQVIHRVCVCGDETEVGVAPAAAHDFDVIMGCPNNSKALTVEELVCKTCGHTIEKHVTYEVSKSQWGSSKLTVIDMSKYNGELQQNGISDDQIEMRFYIDTSFYDKNARYVVTRIDEDGNHYDYETRLQNGYLIFDPDHFSIYVIGAVDEKTGEPSQIGMSYEEALSLLASPDPDEEPTGGPGETIGSTAPESSPHGPGSSNHGSGGGSHYTTGWALDSKRIDDLVNTTITSSEGVDLSLRSPKTGQICLRHFSIPYAKDGIRAA